MPGWGEEYADEENLTDEIDRLRVQQLSTAVTNGDTNTVRFLLDIGTNPNIKDRFEWTPLMRASKDGYTEIVDLLLNNGADPNIQNSGGLTALMHAISRASDHGKTEIVKLLLDNGADPNIKEYTHTEATFSDGQTALMEAAKRGKIEIVKILLEYGADPNIRRDDGMTALDLAKQPNPRARPITLRGKIEIVKLFDYLDIDDEPSDPDINLMKDEAARHIQTIMRARFETDKKRKLTKRRYGTWASPKTEREKDRRYMDLIRQFGEEDPIRGYERYSIYPERLLPIKGGKRDRRKSKGKRDRRKSKGKRDRRKSKGKRKL
jgi:hypothetical protein